MGLKECLGGLKLKAIRHRLGKGAGKVCVCACVCVCVCVVCVCVCVHALCSRQMNNCLWGSQKQGSPVPLLFLFSPAFHHLLPFWTKVPPYLEPSPCLPFWHLFISTRKKRKHLFSLLCFLTCSGNTRGETLSMDILKMDRARERRERERERRDERAKRERGERWERGEERERG